MPWKEKHCVFAQLNDVGRCTANCVHNWDAQFKWDCIGATGGTTIKREAELNQLPTKESVSYE